MVAIGGKERIFKQKREKTDAR